MSFELKRGDTLSLLLEYREDGVLSSVEGVTLSCTLYSADHRRVQSIAIVPQAELGILHATESKTLWPEGDYTVVFSLHRPGLARTGSTVNLRMVEKWQ